MSEEVKATTQYGDLKGTIAIDGWDGLSALSVGAGGRKGYQTVGFEFYAEPDTKGDPLDINAYVYVVDDSILDGKPGPDAVRAYAKQHGHVPVFRFRSKLTPEKLLDVIKRINVVFQDKATAGKPMMLVGDDETHE